MPPAAKRRKFDSAAVEEITFDPSARQEYLTGFHKRKLERAKHAREIAEKQARAEKLEARRQLRDERKADLERHVAEVNALLDTTGEGEDSGFNDEDSTTEEWNGIMEVPQVDHEAEYIDEDKYTTVTVESMDLSKDGLGKLEKEIRKQDDSFPEEKKAEASVEPSDIIKRKKRPWTREKPRDQTDKVKKRKKKFRYETKAERKFTRMKQGARNSREAKARREK